MSNIIQHTFDNGCRLIYQQNNNSQTCATNIFVKVGSVNEPANLGGISHFIEHMIFKGDGTLNSKDVSSAFDSVGAYINAYTTFDHTCYYFKSHSDYLEKCLNVYSKILINANMDNTEFDKEKNVVVDEIIRSNDNTEGLVNEKIYELIFKGSSLENPIGGRQELIEKYDYEESIKFYKSFYKPSNMVISICSDKSFDEVKNIVSVTELALSQSGGADKNKSLKEILAERKAKADKHITQNNPDKLDPNIARESMIKSKKELVNVTTNKEKKSVTTKLSDKSTTVEKLSQGEKAPVEVEKASKDEEEPVEVENHSQEETPLEVEKDSENEEESVKVEKDSKDEEEPVEVEKDSENEEESVEVEKDSNDEEEPVDVEKDSENEEESVKVEKDSNDEEESVEVEKDSKDEEEPVEVEEKSSDEEETLVKDKKDSNVSKIEDIVGIYLFENLDLYPESEHDRIKIQVLKSENHEELLKELIDDDIKKTIIKKASEAIKLLESNYTPNTIKFEIPEEYRPNNNIETIDNLEDRTSYEERDLEQVYMSVGFRSVSRTDDSEAAFDILKVILAGNMSSILFTNLRENNGITYNVSIDNSNFEKSGIFTILTSVDREKLITFKDSKTNNLRQGALPIIIESLNPLCKEGVTQEQLDLAKGFIKGTIAIQSEDSQNISAYNGKNIMFDSRFKDVPMNELYHSKYKNITLEDINSILVKFLNKDNIYYFFIGKNLGELKEKITITQKTYTCEYNKDDIKNAVKDVLGLFPQTHNI